MESRDYKKIFLYLPAILFLLLLVIAAWEFLQKTAGRVAGDFLYPYLRAARSGFDSLSDQTLLVFSRRELASQLENMRAEYLRLSAQAAAASDLLHENERLRQIMKLKPPADWKYIHAEVILRDPRFWRDQLTVDKGTLHGIRQGAAALAVSESGHPVLAGVVAKAYNRTSVIMTVFNHELRMSAALPSSSTAGILHVGSMKEFGDLLSIGFLPLQKQYTIGEMLQTSGFEQDIPPGIKIGNLADIQPLDSRFSSELYLSGLFLPALRLNEVRYLVIAVRQEPQLQELME